jgi:hypothetical protein
MCVSCGAPLRCRVGNDIRIDVSQLSKPDGIADRQAGEPFELKPLCDGNHAATAPDPISKSPPAHSFSRPEDSAALAAYEEKWVSFGSVDHARMQRQPFPQTHTRRHHRAVITPHCVFVVVRQPLRAEVEQPRRVRLHAVNRAAPKTRGLGCRFN